MSAHSRLHALAATGDCVSPRSVNEGSAGGRRGWIGRMPALRHDVDRRHLVRRDKLGTARTVRLPRADVLRSTWVDGRSRQAKLAGGARLVEATSFKGRLFHGPESACTVFGTQY